MKWHFQFSPNDPYDYDSVAEMVLANLNIGGKPTKALMDVNRNGFMYVLDRADGKLIAANQYITKQTWAKGIDESGRPIPTEITDEVRKGKEVDVWPGAMGGKNWSPVSFDPETGLIYANTLEFRHALQAGRRAIPRRPDLLGRRHQLDLARRALAVA